MNTIVKLTPNGFEQLTALATVKRPTPPKGTRFALINCNGQAVRWRHDNIDPTATIGMIMNTADEPLLFTAGIGKLIFIEAVAGGIVNISYYF